MKAYDVLFRTDASTGIGTGHLMRCLALADALAALGARCGFLARSDSLGSLATTIGARGHTLLPLAGHPPTRSGQAEDAALCHAALPPGHPPAQWLVVDHYALDAQWEGAMRASARHLLVVDDLADRPHDCDLLLDQSLVPDAAGRYVGLLKASCRMLLGPRHALLRPEFARDPAESRAETGRPPRLLVMFGGADPRALTLRVVRLLVQGHWEGEADVVVGSLFAHGAELRGLLAPYPGIRLHVDIDDVAVRMRQADAAIGSPGVSSWERCSTGLPSIAIGQAANQQAIGVALAEAGAHLYLGQVEEASDEAIAAALRLLSRSPAVRRAMGRAATAVCDGRGTTRVARLLWPTTMRVRRATMEDAALLFAWRNDPRTRVQSLDPQPLGMEGHLAWLQRVLLDPDDLLLVLETEAPQACVRFSIRGTSARVSIYTDPDRQGQGLGSAALQAATTWLKDARPGIELLEAEVLQGNAASHAMFSAAGYAARWTRYEYRLSPPERAAQRRNQDV